MPIIDLKRTNKSQNLDINAMAKIAYLNKKRCNNTLVASSKKMKLWYSIYNIVGDYFPPSNSSCSFFNSSHLPSAAS